MAKLIVTGVNLDSSIQLTSVR